MEDDTRSEKGRFGPLPEDAFLVGTICHMCNEPMKAGDRPTLVGDAPADAEEAVKKAAGRAYNAVADAVHEKCAWPDA